ARVSARQLPRGDLLGLPATGERCLRPPHRLGGHARASGAAGAPWGVTPGGGVERAARAAARHDRGDGTVALGVPRRCERRGVPDADRRRHGLVARGGGGGRGATAAGRGLGRGGFRGGGGEGAYRTVIGAVTDWLLGGGAGSGERFAPLTYEVANGLSLVWRWTGKSGPRDVPLTLTGPG